MSNETDRFLGARVLEITLGSRTRLCNYPDRRRSDQLVLGTKIGDRIQNNPHRRRHMRETTGAIMQLTRL